VSVAGREDRKHATGEIQQPSRSAFERDRDRILYSEPFRRLAGVTQVVHAAEGHAFHNRLTHSLKVAQFGRRITQRFLAHQPALASFLNADVVETACLAHDLGHPPFGHVGEEELNRSLTSDYGVADGYEGNAQSFRIVTKLAVRSDKHEGLNLTRASLRKCASK
jgi:dGTPase